MQQPCFFWFTSFFRYYSWLLSCNMAGYMICGAQFQSLLTSQGVFNLLFNVEFLPVKGYSQVKHRPLKASRMPPQLNVYSSGLWSVRSALLPEVATAHYARWEDMGGKVNFPFPVFIGLPHILLTLQVTFKGLQPPCWKALDIWVMGRLEACLCLVACHVATTKTRNTTIIPYSRILWGM